MTKPGEVRIIGGVWRRSKLPVLNLPGLRPSGDRLRETLFNWLPHDLSGWRVLDAFAGSGALGLEAASRGATVHLVEREPKAAASLKQVIARLQGASDRVTLIVGDGFAALAGRWDLVLIDPPFEANGFAKALSAAAGAGWIYLEAPAAFEPPAGYRLHRHLKAGAVHAHLFARDN
ncbi:MAG: RsmD family RNA methyltransferase [Inhella sp.]|uniref:RsmD family RNA methyltransferase n=1 Tax=Inhella sp. TaxID=1921806 RepID=UPI003919AC1D